MKNLPLDIVTEVVGHMTARIVLPLLSFGKVKIQGPHDVENGFNWFGFRRQADGTFLLEFHAAGLAGVLIWLVVLITVLMLLR